MKALLLLFSAAKFGKLLTTGGTMLVSLVVYAFIYGWRYAAGFVVLLFVHETGHFIAARQRGLDVGAPTFIPFVGAWIELKDQPRDAETEAWVGLGGPLLGTIGALAAYYLARGADANWLLAVAYAGFFLNLFNLIPLSPFDGGRITAVLSPRVWLAGVPILVVLFFHSPSPILILMAVLAAPQVLRAWRYDPKAPENLAYYDVSAAKRLEYASYYLGLICFLAVMCLELHEMLPRGSASGP